MRRLLVFLLLPIGGSFHGLAADAPAPRLVWLEGPMEVRVRYQPKIDAVSEKAIIEALAAKTIPYYEIDWTKDGYRPRGEALGRLRIAGARVVDGGETLVLATDPQPRRAVYVLDWLRPAREELARYVCSGVETSWYDGPEATTPSLSSVGQRFEFGAGEGGQLVVRKGGPHHIVLRTTLLMPKGTETLVFRGNLPFEATLGNKNIEANQAEDKSYRAEFAVTSTGEPIDLEATLNTVETKSAPEFSARWKRGDSEIPIPSSQLSLTWLPLAPAATNLAAPPYDLSGGNPVQGEQVFLSETAKCSSCHAIGGKGGNVGPSLDSWKGRKFAEIYQQIAEPSATINPEYRTYTVARKDGQIAVGVVKAEGSDAIRVADINGQATLIPKNEIEEMRPSSASTMPVGLAGAIGEEKMRDLMAFLAAGKKP